jgi:hypothetical protein
MPDCNMPCSDYKRLLNENIILKNLLDKKDKNKEEACDVKADKGE